MVISLARRRLAGQVATFFTGRAASGGCVLHPRCVGALGHRRCGAVVAVASAGVYAPLEGPAAITYLTARAVTIAPTAARRKAGVDRCPS